MADTYTITIKRFDSSVDAEPYTVTYEVPDDPGFAPMTALKALHYINRYVEPIAYEFNCRRGTCGRCSILVDGEPNDDWEAPAKAMRDLGVGLIGQAKVTQVGEGFVEYETAEGAIERIEADTVVSSFGLKPDLAAVDALKGIVRDTYVVGDARQARNIFWANRDAFDVAVEL